MNRNLSRPTLSMVISLLAMIACALPGQTIEPPPALNPLTIESAVAGTAQVAAQQTEQGNVVPATATIIPAQVVVTHEVISSYETSLVKRADGSTQFRDYRAGVQMLFPSNWLPVRPGEPEYYEAWEKQGTQSQWILEEIASIQTLDLNVFRVNAYDMHPEHFFYGTLPKINVVFQQDDTRTLQRVEADEKRMIEISGMEGHEFLSSDFRMTSAGLQILVFENQSQSRSDDGVGFMFYHKGTFFKVPTGLVFIDLYIPSDRKEVMAPQYNEIIESITLFNP